LVGRRKIW